jgi:hypothetical protein
MRDLPPNLLDANQGRPAGGRARAGEEGDGREDQEAGVAYDSPQSAEAPTCFLTMKRGPSYSRCMNRGQHIGGEPADES